MASRNPEELKEPHRVWKDQLLPAEACKTVIEMDERSARRTREA
jgi:hypothetical protein